MNLKYLVLAFKHNLLVVEAEYIVEIYKKAVMRLCKNERVKLTFPGVKRFSCFEVKVIRVNMHITLLNGKVHNFICVKSVGIMTAFDFNGLAYKKILFQCGGKTVFKPAFVYGLINISVNAQLKSIVNLVRK